MLNKIATTARALVASAVMPVDPAAAVALDKRHKPTTVDRADSLVAALEAELSKTGAAGSSPLRNALSRQIEQAKQHSAFLNLKEEIEARIPEALKRSAAHAIAAHSAAKTAEEEAQRGEAKANKIRDARRAELENLKEARATALIAPTAALQLAKVELGRSKAAGEPQNIDRARTQMNEALRVLEDVERGQRSRDLEIEVMTDSVTQASAEAEQATAAHNECLDTLVAAHVQVEAVASDSATFASLLAYMRVYAAAKSRRGQALPRAFGQSTFSFHSGAHAPFCGDVDGGLLVDGWRLQRIRNALEDASWSAFEVDFGPLDDQPTDEQSSARI